MRKIILIALFFIPVTVFSQDTLFARRIIDTLTSNYFNGRGYTNDGVNKTLLYLKKQFDSLGLKPMNKKNFIQQLSYNVNTFPGEMSVKINGKELKPGEDFIVTPESRGIHGKFEVSRIDSNRFQSSDSMITISIEDKLTWSVSQKEAQHTTIKILRSSMRDDPKNVEVDITNRYVQNFRTGNLCGFVKGKSEPDSFIIFTAHYDHLGGMGKETYFPGANDNASGISMLLGLAKYYAKNPQRYSIGFICFTGEEAGLVGSEYFTKHPLIDLKSIRFLVNLDLTGTGVEGITVVNATIYKKEFELLNLINDDKKYLTAINSRGKAKNSDHFWFTERKVPSFFIYTLGGIKAYHDVYDVSATLPNNEYIDLTLLLKEFVNRLVN